MGNSFKGIGTEILTDTLHAMALEKQLQRLVDRERDLNVETAQRRTEIEQLKMIAEDVTKSEEERLTAAEKAFKIETDLLEKRITNAEEAVRIEEARLSQILDPTAEALDLLAQKEIDLATIQGESATKQIELNNKINAIKAEAERVRAENHQKALDDLKTLMEAQEEAEVRRADGKFASIARFEALDNKNTLDAIENVHKRAETALKIERDAQLISTKYLNSTNKQKASLDKEYSLKVIALDKFVQKSKMDTISMGLQVAGQLAKEGSVAAKGIAVAQTIYNTQQSIMAAMAQVPYPYNIVQSILNGVMGANAIRTILSTDPSGGSVGGSVGVAGGGAAPPSPQMMSGAFELTGGQEVEPVQAYVVSDDITNNQNKLAIIRRRATI